MTHLKLSELVEKIEDVIQRRFAGETFWLMAEITDVKKYAGKRWCFLKFIEKEGNAITTEIKGVFWSNTYQHIEKFESATRRVFGNGLEITCNVRVRFHPRFGLDLEVLAIDVTYALGKLELEKQQTLERLLKENPDIIQLVDGQYITANKKTELSAVLQRIALVTAPNSDGQRDFKQEIEHNQYGYAFSVAGYLTQIQGDNASKLIIQQLQMIEARVEDFDVVAIVRGGGSQTDFKPFDDYELAKYVAAFPLPVLTGIGHDRNTSIVDMFARQHKTPTKVAASIVAHNYNFETLVINLKERFLGAAEDMLARAKENLQSTKRLIKSYSPVNILNKGYAIITVNGRIIVNPQDLKQGEEIKTVLKNELIHSTITKKTKNELDL